MFKNYFKTALRNLWKNKLTTSINFFGLSIGMSAAVFIFIWVQNEITFDNFQPGKDHIYRATNAIQVSKTETWVWESSPLLLTDAAIKEIPEVEQVARLQPHRFDIVFNINHKLFSEKTSAFIDYTWFNMFRYQFTAGNATAFRRNPFSIVLTESKAKKYFGNADPLGQLIRVDTVNYTVEGVVKDNPLNSSFQFDILMNLDGHLSDPNRMKNDKTWNNFGYMSFLQLRPSSKKIFIETKLNEIVNKNRTNHNDKVSIQPLTGMYFESDLQSSDLPHGNRKTTYIFSILGLLLLFIACINYVNLTTAKASLRSKEVSVRKMVGAERSHLFFQFLTESLTVSLVSLGLTLLIVKLSLPVFNSITEKNFQLTLTSITLWKVLGGTLLIAFLLNGIYPAILLSSFKPLNVFRGRGILNLRDGFTRKGLVIFQFVLSMVLIFGTIVVYRQLKYIQTTNPGYNVSQIISLPIPYKTYASLKEKEVKTFFASMKETLRSQSSIAAVCTGGAEIVNIGNLSSGNAGWDGRDTTFNPSIATLSADEDFQKMFELKIKEGRWFLPGNTDLHNFIINETAEATFKMHKPTIGQRFSWGSDTGQVIGIIKDFHYKNMHEMIGPLVVSANGGSDNYFFVKTVPGNIPKTLSAVETVWSKYIPDQPFSYTFLDDSFNTLYKTDIKTSMLIFIFSGIAIIISALGLFALAAFTAEQRTKEIGIRKVLGASVEQITTMLSKDFVKLVSVAIIIASPLAWWIMNKWLLDFAYRINISVWIFIASGSLALAIALVSVGVQAIRAAVANPVKSLRTE